MSTDGRRKYKARHILVEDMEDANYVIEKLNAGEEFVVDKDSGKMIGWW